MKRLLFAVGTAVLLMTGAGCSSGVMSSITGSDTVEGKWDLAFDLPSGWVQVAGYAQPNTELPTLSEDVNHTMGMITLQSTNKPIARTTAPATSISAESYVTTNYTKIDVDTLDPRRTIPKDAEDLGNGFSKAAPVVKDCVPGSCTTTYYFKTADGAKYMFTVWANGQDEAVAQSVILSAKVVTQPTDTVPAVTTGTVQTK